MGKIERLTTYYQGLVQSTGSLARAFGPAGITSLFAFSQEHHLLDGQLVHLVLITVR